MLGGYAFFMFLVAFFYYVRSKNVSRSMLIFSVGFNLILFVEAFGNSAWFRIYNLEWLQYFSLFIWPFLNIFFIVKIGKKYERV